MVRNILWSTALAGCVALVGFGSACAKSNSDGGVGVCSSNGSCPNDGTPSQSDIDQCNTIVDGPCGSQFTSYANCAASKATCSAAGTSQLPAGDCSSEATSYAQCMTADGGSTHTDGGSTGTDGSTTFDSGGQTFDTGTPVDTGTPTGSTYCSDIIQCANNCGTDSNCAQACYAMGTPTAQQDFQAVLDCLFGSDGMSGACGSMCASMTTACSNCLDSAQSSGGACYSQVTACAGDMSRTLPPVRNVRIVPSAN